MSKSENDTKPLTVRLNKASHPELYAEILQAGSRKGAPRLLELAARGLQAEQRGQRAQPHLRSRALPAPEPETPATPAALLDLLQRIRPDLLNVMRQQLAGAPDPDTPPRAPARPKPPAPAVKGVFQEVQTDAAPEPETNPALAAMLNCLES